MLPGNSASMLDDPHIGAVRDLGGQLRVRLAQLLHAGLQAQRIQRADDESAVAALRAAQLADQPLARSLLRIGKGRVHDLNQ